MAFTRLFSMNLFKVNFTIENSCRSAPQLGHSCTWSSTWVEHFEQVCTVFAPQRIFFHFTTRAYQAFQVEGDLKGFILIDKKEWVRFTTHSRTFPINTCLRKLI
jgi:hypothetical protein